ncbi:hypothetical protein A2V49_03135 [candidate division WWE3 bacterium RBG_19FT_COMBO_34_6]|uniref:UPF0102 protein A2V49_03135 n=1 Tax=candidate division WWE3 bacterium RBG_19FT_COMBO_34_6 TaxID=1802612 RepID=A0A1F4UK20_UNCKA|nr:MAG: hypothetical protein A2V49_03135 [candidate division WWE3 bacterium RBG_19FT_COMBO_34_6]
MNTKSRGALGELIAKEYLLRNHYKIIQQNWTSRWAEIDFVTKNKEFLVFIEVKYKTSTIFGYPTDEINNRKLFNIKKSIYTYLLKNDLFGITWRFDVISVTKIKNKYKLEHYKFVELPC